ncbi:hypothetical protein [Rufibacter immobilis]|uniref:hypothetical protein n=1 Tax=Rufibacter immobilis TaxID=1348778 RepID=UPI0035EEA268
MNTLLTILLFAFPSASPAVPPAQELQQWKKLDQQALVQIYAAPEDSVKRKKGLEKLYTKTLISMTDSEKAGVRCSAFLALVKLDHEMVKEIFLKHLDDDERLLFGVVWSLFANYEQVNQFMLEQLHPENSKSSYRLTKQEYEKYRKQIYR